MRRIALFCALAMLPWADLDAQQKRRLNTFRVTANVETLCHVTASDLAFGPHTTHSGSELQVTNTCTPNVTYEIGLNEGRSPGATIEQRRMVSGGKVLNYQLYSDSQRRNIWGNTPGRNTVTGTGTGLSEDHTVFGSAPAAQAVPAGDYTDTVTVYIYY